MLVFKYMETQTIFINIYVFSKGLSWSKSLIIGISTEAESKKAPDTYKIFVLNAHHLTTIFWVAKNRHLYL